jgi:hypothetical protein
MNDYGSAYAHYAPIFRDMYAARSRLACESARADISETLRLRSVEWAGANRDPYAGKLWAELDAVRDRLMAISKREAA